MRNKKITLSIIKEARTDENRTPLVPSQISNLLDKLSNLKIIVQPKVSNHIDAKTWIQKILLKEKYGKINF